MATTTPEEAIAGALKRPRKRLIAKRRHRQLVLTYMFLIPASTIFILYRLVPLGWNFLLSFQFWSPTAPAEFAGLYHYEEMFLFDNVFREALKNTMIYMLTAPIGIVLALGLAMLVNAEIKNRSLYRTLIFLSYPLMTVGVGIIWRWLYDEKVGLFNFILRSLGIIDQPIAFLESFSTALAAIMAAAIWQILGFFM
ncbi:MAG: carbohydrate ABC transporter permease, partial [Alphaproteobacteria bacterium]